MIEGADNRIAHIETPKSSVLFPFDARKGINITNIVIKYKKKGEAPRLLPSLFSSSSFHSTLIF